MWGCNLRIFAWGIVALHRVLGCESVGPPFPEKPILFEGFLWKVQYIPKRTEPQEDDSKMMADEEYAWMDVEQLEGEGMGCRVWV